MRRRALILICMVFISARLSANEVSREATCDELLHNEWLRVFTIHNLNQLINFPDNWALGSQQIMVNLMVHFQNSNLDFVFFERFFRENNVPLYLVANSLPLPEGLRMGYLPEMAKLKNNSSPQYHLWTGVKGAEEAARMKARLGISDEENLRRLAVTGLIRIDDEEAARKDATTDIAEPQMVKALSQVGVRNPFLNP